MRVTEESTALATVAYDDARELLQLEFCSWVVYLYCGVPAAVHPALVVSSSPSGSGLLSEQYCA
jgi:hypothetical protein